LPWLLYHIGPSRLNSFLHRTFTFQRALGAGACAFAAAPEGHVKIAAAAKTHTKPKHARNHTNLGEHVPSASLCTRELKATTAHSFANKNETWRDKQRKIHDNSKVERSVN
jgi:hypothetical protein